jgi:hypothetical protein
MLRLEQPHALLGLGEAVDHDHFVLAREADGEHQATRVLLFRLSGTAEPTAVAEAGY